MNETLHTIRRDETEAYVKSPEARDTFNRAREAIHDPSKAAEFLRDDPEKRGWAKAKAAQHEGRDLPDLALFGKEEFWGWMDGVESWPDGDRKGHEFLRIADECDRRANALTDTAVFLERRREVYRRLGKHELR